MGTVQEIEAAIKRLPRAGFLKLHARLQRRFDDEWDQQRGADAKAGRWDHLAGPGADGFSTPGEFPLSVSGQQRPHSPMKRFLRSLLVTAMLCPLALLAGERSNTVLLHPGEVVYARFTQKGKKLTLVGTSKERDETAQVILTMAKTAPAEASSLQVQNKFAQDLVYKMEIRSLTLKRRVILPVVPVVAGKLSREELPPYIEQLAAFAFELAP